MRHFGIIFPIFPMRRWATNDDATHSFHFFLLAAVGGRQQRYSALIRIRF